MMSIINIGVTTHERRIIADFSIMKMVAVNILILGIFLLLLNPGVDGETCSGRQCECKDGKCCRIRREYGDLTVDERIQYIQTVKTASTHPKYKRKYNTLIRKYKSSFNSGIQTAKFFFPWHRWFILEYENLLRQIDNTIVVPYWASTIVAADPLSSTLWWPGPQWFGGNGAKSCHQCVLDGPFRKQVWSVTPRIGLGCLKRDIRGTIPDVVDIQKLFHLTDKLHQFTTFENFIRIRFHYAVLCVVNGQMCSDNGAAAPEFFLNQGYIDKLWANWQSYSNLHKSHSFFASQTDHIPGISYIPKDFIDSENLPGGVCVKYIEPQHDVFWAIEEMKLEFVKEIPRLPIPSLPLKAVKVFNITREELVQASDFVKTLEPEITLTPAELVGRGRALGYNVDTYIKGINGPIRTQFKNPNGRKRREIRESDFWVNLAHAIFHHDKCCDDRLPNGY